MNDGSFGNNIHISLIIKIWSWNLYINVRSLLFYNFIPINSTRGLFPKTNRVRGQWCIKTETIWKFECWYWKYSLQWTAQLDLMHAADNSIERVLRLKKLNKNKNQTNNRYFIYILFSIFPEEFELNGIHCIPSSFLGNTLEWLISHTKISDEHKPQKRKTKTMMNSCSFKCFIWWRL